MAQHIAQKLRLTSALLGTVSRKDLAAAFRRVNPKTAFGLGRADKWLQGPPVPLLAFFVTPRRGNSP